jgi:hypothetical protein
MFMICSDTPDSLLGRRRVDREAQAKAVRFVRKMLDEALAPAPEALCVDPLRLHDRPGSHPLSHAFVRTLRTHGWEMRSSNAWKLAYGNRIPCDLGDLLNMTLVAAGRARVLDAAHNDRARQWLANEIAQTFHRKEVVLFRPRAKRTGASSS